MIQLTITGHPLAKKRHRCGCRGGHPVAYDSQANDTRKQRLELIAQVERECVAGPLHALERNYLHLELVFCIEPPISDSKSHKNAKLWGMERPIQADLDNRIKWICDLGNRILWPDDAQIVSIIATEKYSENPCTIIEIHAIDTAMNPQATAVTKLFSPTEIELFHTHLCVLRDAIGRIEAGDTDEKTFYIENASVELIRFAADYSDKLKKLAKWA